MGAALLIDSTKVIPKRMKDTGYKFKFTELKTALEYAVK
jgi:NAD dependent epimerase/dehydratase family enzyme